MTTPRATAWAQVRRSVVGSPAWNPQATFALVTSCSIAASSPSTQVPKDSPRSALRSIRGAGGVLTGPPRGGGNAMMAPPSPAGPAGGAPVTVTDHAADWADVALQVLRTPYPYATAHLSTGPDDVEVTPDRLHPAFHGSLDWHSSVHMQWSLVRLLTLAPDALGERATAAAALLDERLTSQALQVEADYL